MAPGLILLLGGCCMLLLAIRQVHALWHDNPIGDTPPPAERAAPASSAWAPFIVGPGTGYEDLKRQYHALARRYHPDCGGDARLMAALNARFAEVMQHYIS
jgi:hypothetical protein